MPRILDLAGQRYGRLTVIKFSHRSSRHTFWWSRCDCGVEKLTISNKLRTGATLSCGCLNREKKIERLFRHGFSGMPEHKAWREMKRRCTDPKHHAWSLYGGRGIIVCTRWINSFEAFYADMGPRPDKCEIDRIDNNGNYEPSNCRWTTKTINSRNRRTCRMLEYKGEALCIADWADKTGIRYGTIRERLNRGWSVERALTGRVL